ncbi:MAG: 2-oxoacid:acceptor oxidoreductase family protein [Candidatus Thermoplasmatota archaeon]|nr:2-oxoacid:acceptor oxidoreductase family protein [Candidatus Thermoplasmatota archaeon]
MIEIRFHGRGGQGAVVASKVLADAAFREGNDVQAFPYFGVERRGAPVTAFTKIDKKNIRNKAMIYEPNIVVVLEYSLLSAVDVTSGLKDDGIVIINSDRDPNEIAKELGVKRVACVNATKIATDNKLGSKVSPIVNTSLVGAIAKATGLVKIESVTEAIMDLPVYPERNAEASKQAYESVKMSGGA